MANKNVKVTLYCLLCSESVQIPIKVPKGWRNRYDSNGMVEVEDERSWCCPKHQEVLEFAENQCSGCVGGWGDCGLFSRLDDSCRPARARTTRNYKPLDEEAFLSISRGLCPERVNGTFSLNVRPQGAEFTDIDLSELATVESGEALVKAFREYIERHAERGSR
jgi:hypothetical protein